MHLGVVYDFDFQIVRIAIENAVYVKWAIVCI